MRPAPIHKESRANEACCQSVVAECWLNECNHAKRSQLLETSRPPLSSSRQQPTLAPTQRSEVRGTATHSWQRLTTQHMCTFTYTNAPLYTYSCQMHVCSVCFMSNIHLTVMGRHSWKTATTEKHLNRMMVPRGSWVW